MIIACDIDGPLYEYDRTARYMLREYKSYKELIFPSTDWNYIQDRITLKDWEWLHTEAIDLGLYRYGHVTKGAILGINQLRTCGYEVVFVTHRPSSAVQDTLDFLAYARLQPAGVHILTHEEAKTSVPADLYLDDRPENIEDAIQHKAKAVLFDTPWNQATYSFERSPNYRRARGWKEVIQMVEEIR